MHCFNHNNIPAVCLCATFHKGLCQNRMQPSEDRFVCSNPCDEEYKKISSSYKKTFKFYGLDRSNKYKGRFFCYGLMFSSLGFYL